MFCRHSITTTTAIIVIIIIIAGMSTAITMTAVLPTFSVIVPTVIKHNYISIVITRLVDDVLTLHTSFHHSSEMAIAGLGSIAN